MIRDTFFSLPRFVNVCRKEMVEGWKANLLRVVLMYGMLAIVLVWNGMIEYGGYNRSMEDMERHIWTFGVVAFAWGLVIMGCLSASFTMERMKTKNNRLSVLMTPATMFEKFFARWLVFTFGFLLAYLVAYKLADWTRMLFLMVKHPGMESVGSVPLLSLLVGGGRDSLTNWTLFRDCGYFMMAVGGYFLFQSCFVLGSSVWPKNAFMKTFVAGVVIVIGYVLAGALAVKLCWNASYMMNDMNEPSEETMKLLITLFSFGMALFNWVLAYFRFKESEIINRW